MTVSFHLDAFKAAFDKAVSQQRLSREDVGFEFGGQKISVQGSTKLSDAVEGYLDSLSESNAFTGPETFDAKSPDALVRFLEDRPNIDISTVALAVREAKLMQQGMRNGRSLSDIWDRTKVASNLTAVGILGDIWSHGEELKRLKENDRLGLAHG